MPLYTGLYLFLHNSLNVLVRIANKKDYKKILWSVLFRIYVQVGNVSNSELLHTI
jgi:hypothetical protein